MEDLIKALQIFLKYGNPEHPTNCSHDVLYVGITPEKVSEEDLEILDELGFFPDEDECGFSSYRFGSY
ncbi:hypothetical protein J8L13_04715 [Bacteroides fragilis]|uniref:hypothetical protein n=1 Tax=Bacteroides fragilis TaxID=817 RepID=UPI00202FED1B|nr:hypothetical protein [Bacteroides fragilis]MCM0236713.1 hypothetical protein [Bacteroides fragilis]